MGWAEGLYVIRIVTMVSGSYLLFGYLDPGCNVIAPFINANSTVWRSKVPIYRLRGPQVPIHENTLETSGPTRSLPLHTTPHTRSYYTPGTPNTERGSTKGSLKWSSYDGPSIKTLSISGVGATLSAQGSKVPKCDISGFLHYGFEAAYRAIVGI